ncbi:MAG TPA: NAD-glutamate dehydrogenase domain-containing protein, partial [Sphingomonadaceae bacterium]|nr:NAD-glutamate dehydrogenase domain-containing protein [Sphingomonadaceae bacterium]
MASAKGHKPIANNSPLANKLARRIGASLLPGEPKLRPERLLEASNRLLHAARRKAHGEPAIVLHSGSNGHRYLGIAIVNDDMPFLVDSVAATIAAQGLAIDCLVHPVVSVTRGKTGRLVDIGKGDCRESYIYIETQRIDAKERNRLSRALEEALADVRAAVSDWPKMQELMEADAERTQGEEGALLLRWLANGMLTQLGHVTRQRDGRQRGRLGICRTSARTLLSDETYQRAFEWFDTRGSEGVARAPLIVKANRISKVHRRVPLDLFMVPIIENGKVAALSVHAGIWTSASLHEAPANVPRLRTQIARMADRLGFTKNSHDGNALSHVVAALPRDLLITFSDVDFEKVVTTMMVLVQRPRPRLVLVAAGLERHLFAFVWLPRDMLSTDTRLRIQEMIEHASGGEVLDWGVQVEGGNLALIRSVVDIRGGHRSVDENALDEQLQAMLRGWSEAVESEIEKTGATSRAAALAALYAESFPVNYRVDYGPGEAALDILRLRHLQAQSQHGDPGRDARLYRLPSDENGRLRLKIYQPGGSMPLSDAVPALENFGFRVLAEIPTPLQNGALATIHDFMLELPRGGDAATVLERQGEIEEALCAVLNNHAEDDVFNRLTVGAALSARCANLLRAVYRYLRQTGFNVTIYPVVDALDEAVDVTNGLIALFGARHDPAFKGNRKKAEEAAEQQIRDGLAKVESIGNDRILRRYHAVLGAVLRTNQYAAGPDEALAYKIDSSLVPALPRPIPWREIFVYSRRIEGIHLRAGPVARGGIRWSDRRDDYRTEILGLMKAQRVKNAVIVPTGAKGGFLPKRLPDPRYDRDGWAAEGQASYEIFIRSLLSITDNIVDDKVVHPPGIVIRDGEDPYFVVAADKGTARFSDVANNIAESRDFWLDDAFASGGSHGYDHKAMGITARGAWLSVQRHFLELGVDVQKDPVRVIGCGDMSGDVFGNGMLLSKAIKLIGAFDHRHIFIDPDPDPGASWKERKRLFDLPRSSWDDYDKSLISRGGGVFPRSLKRIPLSNAARKALGTEAAELEPDKLIAALLKAPADLLWFGGIGTYVKSAAENNVAVGDPANDALRVNGREIRAKVIGEGANLGCTQAGRIEYALSGGRINTDFIDNSAGVDCSDNEVNIKIAFAAAKRAGKLTEKRRDALLVEMTDEVASIVLEDNRLQALALSIAEEGGSEAIPSYMRLIDELESLGELDRETEGLAEDEVLARRVADEHGLTRPELAVLLSSTKLMLQNAIEQSSLDEDVSLVPMLLEAFPQPMRERFRSEILSHRLRNQLVATKLANRIINRMGMIHPFEIAEEEGASLDHVAAAFVCAGKLFGMEAVWSRFETSPMAENARLMLFARTALALRNHMADLLRAGAGNIPPSKLISELSPVIEELATCKEELLAKEARTHSARLKDEFRKAGVPAKEAEMAAHLFDMDGSVGLARLAVDTRIPVNSITAAFTNLGERLGLDWAQGCAATMNPSDPWERLLVAGLARDFQQMRFDLLRRLAVAGGAKANPIKAV